MKVPQLLHLPNGRPTPVRLTGMSESHHQPMPHMSFRLPSR